MSNGYTIKDLERITGIKAHTIRIWEKRYNIVEPDRTDSNIRSYSDENLKRLLNISILVKHGFKISRVAKLDDIEISEKIVDMNRTNNDYESQVESLVVSMIELDENKFDKILSSIILKIGFENTIFDVIYPLFEKIGVLWQTGSINPAQEHFISNLIRQKLYAAIDSLQITDFDNAKTCMLFLPEWELHDIALLVFTYLLKKKGHKTIFLGQSVPITDLLSVTRIRKPEILFTIFSSSVNKEHLLEYLDNLSEKFSEQNIYISGIQTTEIKDKIHSNISIVNYSRTFKEEIIDNL